LSNQISGISKKKKKKKKKKVDRLGAKKTNFSFCEKERKKRRDMAASSQASVDDVNRGGGGVERSDILYMGFNQDQRCFAVATETGFIIYDSDPLAERFRRDPFKPNVGGIKIVEMLFRCNILALVGGGKNPKYEENKCIIWDDYQNKCLAELEFRLPVRAVRLRKDRILVATECKVYVYNFVDISLLRSFDTAPNLSGLVALSCVAPVLAAPGTELGALHLNVGSPQSIKDWPHLDCAPKPRLHNVKAHNGPLQMMALNNDGTLAATASDKGTLIRIWSTESGAIVDEFRRGTDRAEIHSICFDSTSSVVVVSSDKGTVHLFSLTGDIKNSESSLKGIGSWFTSYAVSKWSFASFRIPEVRTICCFGAEPNTVIAVCADGTYFKYQYVVENREARIAANPEYAVFLSRKRPSV
jgi:WD repeat-containing protein 45